jgi:hypothetical protein
MKQDQDIRKLLLGAAALGALGILTVASPPADAAPRRATGIQSEQAIDLSAARRRHLRYVHAGQHRVTAMCARLTATAMCGRMKILQFASVRLRRRNARIAQESRRVQ